MRTVPFSFGDKMAKLKDTRNWEEEYKKLKVNFDRLDRFNDVLYRFWYLSNKMDSCGNVSLTDIIKASGDVIQYMEGLENERS